MTTSILTSWLRRRAEKAAARPVTAHELDAIRTKLAAIERENFELRAFVIRLAGQVANLKKSGGELADRVEMTMRYPQYYSVPMPDMTSAPPVVTLPPAPTYMPGSPPTPYIPPAVDSIIWRNNVSGGPRNY